VARLYQDMATSLAALPGVTAVSVTSSAPMDGNNHTDPVFPEGSQYAEGQLPPLRRYKFVAPGYLQAMGMRLVAGRDLDWTDIYDHRPAVMVSERLARELWGDPGAALGKRVRETPKGIWREVVGVTSNERDDGLDQKPSATIYWPVMTGPFWQFQTRIQRGVAFTVRSSRASSPGFAGEARRAIWSVNRELPVSAVRTVEELIGRSLARTSFTLMMLGIAAGAALLLGIVGIYGVISYSVTQRTREVGIRMALGARPAAVRAMFVREGALLALVGVACGLAGAAALSRLLKSLLFEVNPMDPVTYVLTSLVLLSAALAASYIPARRATGVEPLDALRVE
jgi:predicted permease